MNKRNFDLRQILKINAKLKINKNKPNLQILKTNEDFPMTEKYRGVFLTSLLFCYIFGIIFAQNFHINILYLTAIFAVFFITTIALFVKKFHKVYLIFLVLFFLLGAIRFIDAITIPQNDISNFSRQEVKIYGTIIEEPKITEKYESKRVRYTLEIKEIEKSNERKKATGIVYLYAPYKDEKVKIGDTVESYASIKKIRPAGNPGAYDRFTHLLTDGITAEAFGGKAGVSVTEGSEHPILEMAAEVRRHYKESMEKVMPKEDAAAIFAMLFGGYNGLQPELTEAFTITGIVHILSVSGSHVSMLATFVAWLGNIFRLPKKPLTILIFVIIAFYTILAGLVPPAFRAAVMGCLVFFGITLDRDIDSKRLLNLVAFGFLLYNPLLLFHISFQLSFLATTGLIYLMPKLTKYFTSLKLPYSIASNFALTISAQLLTLPIIAYYFHRLSISSLLANLLIVPIVEFIIIVALLAGIIVFILPFFGGVIFLLLSLVFGFVYEATRLLAKLPFGNIYLPTMSVFLSIIYYTLFIPVMTEDWLKEKLKVYLAPYKKSVGLFCIVFALIGLAALFTRPKEVMFAFIDVGQGDALLVKTPNNHAFMLDTGGVRDGSFDVGSRVDVPFLLNHDATKLDYIFLTHAHEDHAAGVGGILKYIPVTAVITANEGLDAYQRSMKVGRNIMDKTKFKVADKGEVYTIDGVKVEVLHAPKTATGENEMSNLYRVSYGKASVLVTGDMTKEDELKLVEKNADLRATILKVGHHGSKTSSAKAFLQAVHPKFALISVGADNSFGHPNADTLKNLEEINAKIYRTDTDGAVFFYTDGERMRVDKYLK